MSKMSVARLMPGPRNRDVPRFKGRGVKRFLTEFEALADAASLDEYCRDFFIISRALERKRMLSERDRDDYFFVGIKPLSLRHQIQNILERDSKWEDVTAPPEMQVVMDSTEQYLKRDRYIPRDLEDDEVPTLGSYNDDASDNSSSDSDDGKDSHRYWAKKDTYKKEKDKAKDSPLETKAAKTTESPKMDNTTEDLVQRLERLAITTDAIHKQMSSSSKPFRHDVTHVCYMCGNNDAHNMRDCPETIAFMASGLLKTNTDGKIVRADGRPLPRGVMGSGGIAKVLKDEANRKGSSSNIEVDHDGFLVANYEFARLNEENTVYTVLPAQRAEKAPKKDVRNQPYRRPETRSQAKKHAENTKKNEEREAEKQGESKEKVADIPIRRILPRPLAPPRQDVDVEMRIPPDLVKTTPAEKISEVKDDQTTTTANGKSKTKPNVTFEDVEIIDEANKDKLAGKPKRASPAFKFASAVQESVNQDKFLERVLDEPVTITFRELLSSYEVSKRIQSITKSQKISINGAKEQVSTGSTAKRISNATIKDYYSSSDELEDTNTTTSARITRIGNLEVEQDSANANAPKSSRNARVLTLEAAKSNEANNPFVIRISDDTQGMPAYPSLDALRGNMSLVPRFGNSSISTLNGAYSGVGSSESSHAELLYAEAG